MPTNEKLTGHDAIAYARKHGTALFKHADPTEGFRANLTPEEAEEVCREDPTLIYTLTR
jgi:hypothetical protein